MFVLFDYVGNLKLFVSVCVGILIMIFIIVYIVRSKLCCIKGVELFREGFMGLGVIRIF